MKLARVLLRLTILSLAAAAFVGLTAMYGKSARLSFAKDPAWQEGRDHRPSAPQAGYVAEFAGEGLLLAFFAVAGRLVFRLRLNPAPRGEGQSILLDLHRARRSLNPPRSPDGPSAPVR